MDRQSLLEQKRQRLQELKQRRLGGLNKDENIVNELVDKFQNSHNETSNKQVSVAIQVDIFPKEDGLKNISHETPDILSQSNANGAQIVTYDKAIQTAELPSDTENENYMTAVIEHKIPDKLNALSMKLEEEKEENVNEEEKEEEEEEEKKGQPKVKETELNSLMKNSFKFLNKILVQETIDSNILQSFSNQLDLDVDTDRDMTEKALAAEPFKLAVEVTAIKGRYIRCIDVSTHNDLFIIASYSFRTQNLNKYMPVQSDFNSITQSPGLAIIYNIKSSKAFPEFFLHCTSEITEIKFDQANPDKVIGGLLDGKIVIWNLMDHRSNGVAILPLLMTPILSNIKFSVINNDEKNVDFIHHTNEISSINQVIVENNECIVSTSLDGVINLWSPNLLAWPKVSSLRLERPSFGNDGYTTRKEIISISRVLLSKEESDLTRSTELTTQAPAYKFLNRLTVGSEDGNLFRLSNNANIGNVGFIHEEEYEREDTLHSSKITSIIELLIETKDTVIATSNLDWSIKIWKSSCKNPLILIPVNYLILDMKVRPNNVLQFITVGMFNQSADQDLCPVIEFWDIGRRLMNPIYSISLNSEAESGSLNSKLYATTVNFNSNGSTIVIGFNDGSIMIWSIDDSILKEVISRRSNNEIDDGLHRMLQRNLAF